LTPKTTLGDRYHVFFTQKIGVLEG
jgi:hypothetical protein